MFIEKKVIRFLHDPTFFSQYKMECRLLLIEAIMYAMFSMGPIGSTSSNESIDDSKPPTRALERTKEDLDEQKRVNMEKRRRKNKRVIYLPKKHRSWRLHCSPSSLVKQSHSEAWITSPKDFTCKSTSRTINFIHQAQKYVFFGSSTRHYFILKIENNLFGRRKISGMNYLSANKWAWITMKLLIHSQYQCSGRTSCFEKEKKQVKNEEKQVYIIHRRWTAFYRHWLKFSERISMIKVATYPTWYNFYHLQSTNFSNKQSINSSSSEAASVVRWRLFRNSIESI